MTQADPRKLDLRPSVTLERLRWGESGPRSGVREVPEETAVAIVHDAATTAVLMASPIDLADLAVGFSLTEGIIAGPAEIRSIEVVTTPIGVEVRCWLTNDRSAALAVRRRTLAGPTGCGLCGIDSLTEAMRSPEKVGEGVMLSAEAARQALSDLAGGQALGGLTHAVHAAAWWREGQGVVAIREDVGRHNALDKLIGCLARTDVAPDSGVLLLTSRVSVEMVQKAAAFGVQILVAVSAPTALAVRAAATAEMTLIAVARADGFEVFNRPDRIRV